jgi:hypothetical protein
MTSFATIPARQIEHRRVQVVDVHFLLDGRPAVLVDGSVAVSRLHSGAGHPNREAGGVVVAAVRDLVAGRAAEFAAPGEQ